MDIDLNRSLQIFQSARNLQKDDIRGLSQKDRKILSVLMTTILKSKEGCKMEIGENDLATLDKDIKAGPPEDHKESGITDKIGNFFKNIFSKRISSKSLFDKIEKTNKKVALLIESENQIKQNKTKIETTITEKTKAIEKHQNTLVGIRCSEHLVKFLKNVAGSINILKHTNLYSAIDIEAEVYKEELNKVDPKSAEGKSYQECLTTLNDLKNAIHSRGTLGAKTFIKKYFDNNPSEKEIKRQIKKSKNEIEGLKQQVTELTNQEAIINMLK